MMHCFLWVGLLACLAFSPGETHEADDKKAWQETELKKFQGRWTAFREERTDKEKVRAQWLDLEIAGGEMTVFMLDENRKQIWNGALKIMGVVFVERTPCLLLGKDGRKIAEVFYDFVGDKMILVGRIAPRPFEGLSLSGEYKRSTKTK